MRGTLLAQLGFEDKELSTPEHDEIVLWVLRKSRQIVGRIVNDDCYVDKVSAEIEVPSLSGGYQQRIVGYHDVVISAKVDMCGPCGMVEIKPISLFAERVRHYSLSHIVTLRVEVKTAIRSVGELVRQLRTVGSNVVVCPDDRFAGVLRDQGFFFIKAPVQSGCSGRLI